MKNLIFLLLLFPFVAFGQTDDYSVDKIRGTPFMEHSYEFALGPDTLIADGDGNDMLYIDFEQRFWSNYIVSICIDATGTAQFDARLLGRNSDTEDWVVVSNAVDAVLGGTICQHFYMSGIPTHEFFGFPYTQLRLRYYFEELVPAVTSIVNASLVLKPQ